MDKKIDTADHIKRRLVPLNVRPVTIGAGIGSAAFRALAILRAVSHSAKDKLGLREAFALAQEQGAAFKRWSELGTPIRRVQVWVENVLVMTVRAEENSVDLKNFNFGVPSPRDAVMRILKADEGEDAIVLLHLPLNTVPRCGLDKIFEFPNGQQIRLEIQPEENGLYDILVAFPPEKDAEGVRDIKRSSAKAAKAGGAGSTRTSSRNRWDYVPTLLPQPRPLTGAWACAFVFLMLGVINGLTYRERQGFTPMTNSNGREASSTYSQGAISVSSPGGGSPGSRVLSVTYDHPVKPLTTFPSVVVAEDRNNSCPASRNLVAANPKHEWNSPPPTAITPTETLLEAISSQPLPEPVKLSEKESAPPEVFAAWDADNLSKLASVRMVTVQVDDTSPAEKSELVTLHSSFVRVLEDSSDWKVTDGSPDAVLKLRFESDQTCLGVVLIEIRDAENNRLFRAFVNCQDLKKGGHEAMFADASTRLVDKLQDTLRLSQGAEKREERSSLETPVSLDAVSTK